MHGTTVKKK